MHHGLQRSGTNYLLLSLLRLGTPVLNYRDPARNDPRHKHCRWQSDKSTLIAPIARQYGNDFAPETIDALDAICRVPKGTAHVVATGEVEAALAAAPAGGDIALGKP
ncbi:hypothetical protein roselon_01360 [Roseibacterium elongatum DSM 19469]|uniref:Uncharacterized protein n=2 Tax=Roseicyclus elongatus TaxID=159346 RepID=W8RRM9_9RHOB|nr:hypothetical protein roselon_01360 [Roseibacterium elongatum DSM 19469]